MVMRIQAQTPHEHHSMIWIQGLESKKDYMILETGEVYSGSQLMYSGVCFRLPAGDSACGIYSLQAIE